MGPHDIHDGVVGVLVRPIALPFQHRGQRGHWLGTCLNDPLHRIVVCQLADVAATVLEDIDLVAIVNGLHSRQGDAGLCPQAGEDDLLAAALLDRCDEVPVVPRVHRRAFNRLLARKDRSNLWPEVSAERFRFDCRQHDGHVEYTGRLGERDRVVDDRLAIEVAGPEQHLRLMVDQRHDAIVGSQEPLLTQLWASAV